MNILSTEQKVEVVACLVEGGCMEDHFKVRFYSKTTDIRDPPPSDVIVFVDEFEDSIRTGIFLPFLPGCNDCSFWEALPGSRHSRACVFSFADGHVGFKRWSDPRTIKIPQRKIHQEEYAGDNSDFAWVR